MTINEDGSYLSTPVMTGERRRLFTFTNPILLSHDGALVATAAEGVSEETADGMELLVLDALWDGKHMQPVEPIHVWINLNLIASAQLAPRSLVTR